MSRTRFIFSKFLLANIMNFSAYISHARFQTAWRLGKDEENPCPQGNATLLGLESSWSAHKNNRQTWTHCWCVEEEVNINHLRFNKKWSLMLLFSLTKATTFSLIYRNEYSRMDCVIKTTRTNIKKFLKNMFEWWKKQEFNFSMLIKIVNNCRNYMCL